MLDATASWGAPAEGSPTAYIVAWTLNGTILPSITVPATTAGQTSGYSLGFVASTGVTPKAGDVIGCTIQADDVTDSLLGPATPTVPPTVTEPTPPPPPPVTPTAVVNPTLTLS